ncbi:hypothetical protein HHK36_027748 [Tetracentron sinense]|uniref:CCHC-type domain-containing protein n=1 Tax=Tetracentron sinense TaxID=13715 RepID=A0A834YFC7_TETSI|nr:hypothetical protein HHK36_027748 [Tetracentron sinense]
MVSQRQKLARKRVKEEHPELFQKPDPPEPSKESKKKKKKSKFKRKRDENKRPKTLNKSNRSNLRKHPLRVPGMKPGESCFICKSKDHIAKLCPQKAQWEKNKICLLCRHRGHSLKNCPNKGEETMEKKFCYNCGDTGHSLSNCTQPLQDGGTKFANCFICNQRGHLSKNCPKNTHGIYPKGGSCKICGGVTHLARDCPNKVNKSSFVGSGEFGERPRGKVTKLLSGDDLDDDFMAEDTTHSNKDDSSQVIYSVSSGAEVEKNSPVKPKKKQGPKIVNFVG